MKVLVVGTGGAVVSGISSAADQMARTLASMGHEVQRLDAGSARRRRPNRLNLQNVGAVLGDAIRVALQARRHRAEVVWYHTFGVPTLPALRGALVAAGSRLGGARPVVHLHAYGLEQHLHEGGPLLKVSLRLVDALSTHVIVLYAGARTELVQQVGARNVSVLENWVEVPSTPPDLPATRRLELLFVGGLVARKGVPELLDAMRQLTNEDVRLTLAGSAGEDGSPDDAHLRVQVSDLLDTGTVRFLGELSREEVAGELDRAHVLVLPSRAEGTPLVVLEAMAHGRAVIVSDAGNLRAVVEGAQCGIVLDRVSRSDVVAAVRRLSSNRGTVTQLGRRGFEEAARRWSPEARHAQLEALLEPGGDQR